MFMKKINLALIGARGAGKSKVSRKLAKLMNWQVFSTDSLISYEASGDTIEKIVAESGWLGFREQEFKVLDKVTGMKGVIIDCGGGILVEAPQNAHTAETFSIRKSQCLKNSCFTVYLKKNLEDLCLKMEPDANRPNLMGDYRTLLQHRLPWYEACADLTVELGEMNVKEVADYIFNKLPKSLFSPKTED